MDKNVVGYDFDGVLCTELKTWWSDILWKLFPKQWSYIVHWLAKSTGVIPRSGSFVITGRCGYEKDLTYHQCWKWGIRGVYIFVDEDKRFPKYRKSIDWKIKIIRFYGITEFHENDSGTIKLLRKEFPNLKIIKY